MFFKIFLLGFLYEKSMYCSPCGTGTNYSSQSTVNGSISIAGNIYDTFSRLIVETPTTLFTSHPAFTPQYMKSLGYISTGTGTFYFDISNCIMLMSTTGSGASRIVRQSLEYQLYQPGKGHNAYFTWTPQFYGTFDNSVAVRCGIYDDYRDKNTPAGTTVLHLNSLCQFYLWVQVWKPINPVWGIFFELSVINGFVAERHNSPNNIINVVRVAQSKTGILIR
ncbi:MAG UNVERIFIED_CONTAM: hypothetical protein LVT10_10505 [Anaerolineae bacterium]|jgi:hypothetical protein